MKEDLFEHIVTKFLEGNATSHEKRMLWNWLKEDPDRKESFYYHLSKWEHEHPQYLPEMQVKIDAYEKFLNGEKTIGRKSYEPRFDDEPHNFSRLNYNWWWAASVIVLLSVSFYLLNDYIFYNTYASQKGMIRSVILEDGSEVTLNANSSVKVPRNFASAQNREVWIKGEAFFEVRKKKGLKFIVHTDHLDVEVLGTKFNVSNRHGKTEVMLAEGKVKLVGKDQQALTMKPGEQVSVSDKQRNFQKHIVSPEKYMGWRQNKFIFENTSLQEVAQIIHNYYGVDVIIGDPALARRQFTGTLPNNDLDVILLALTTAYKIEIEHQEDRIILK
jgi:transmembrane sensor